MATTFHHFDRLPRDLQLLVWNYAFLLVRVQSHDFVLLTREKFITAAIQQKLRPAPQRMEKQRLKHDAGQDGILCMYVNVDGCVSAADVENRLLRLHIDETRDTALIGHGTDSSYRLLVHTGRELGHLLKVCRLSRLAVLEIWKRILAIQIEEKAFEWPTSSEVGSCGRAILQPNSISSSL